MIFRRKPAESAPEPVFSYEIYPDNVDDGTASFDGIEVKFSKPGWRWIILRDQIGWTRPIMLSDTGFPTRDAALVDLLKTVKEMAEAEDDGDEDESDKYAPRI
jgi:hypothetical protein